MSKEKDVLRVLLFHGPLSPAEMIAKTEIPKRSLTRTLSALIEKGFVEKAEDDLTPSRRSSYQIIPTNLPPALIEEFRTHVGVMVSCMKELAETYRPEHTKAVRIFVDSGIFSFEEMKNLSDLYQDNWTEMDFLRDEGFKPTPKFSIGASHTIARSGEVKRTPVKGESGVKCTKMTLNDERAKMAPTDNTERAKMAKSGLERAKMAPNNNDHYSIRDIKRNINKIMDDVVGDENGNPDISVFFKNFRSFFQGCLYGAPDKMKMRYSSDPEKIGKLFLKILFKEPQSPDEAKGKKPTPKKKLPKKPLWASTRTKPGKKKKIDKRTKEAREQNEKQASDRMHPHYWGLTPMERSLRFAKGYIELVRRIKGEKWAGSWHVKLKVNSLSDFSNPGKSAAPTINHIHNARRQADIHGALYEDWIAARFDSWDDRKNVNVSYPTPRYLGSENQAQAWLDYLHNQKASVLCFTRTGLEDTELAYLLPENFHSDGYELRQAARKGKLCGSDKKILDEYEAQCRMYEDYMFPDMQRALEATRGSKDIQGQIKKALRQKIIPAEWVKGYATHHNLPALKEIKL